MRYELSLDKVKELEIGILDYVTYLCDKNGLRYFLDSGTLLGAARHGGFIPWDDDIDIIMPRKDYEKFQDIFPKSKRYQLMSNKTHLDYGYPFIKIIDSSTELYEENMKTIDGYGVYIDVFPIDGLPDKEQERKHFQNRVLFYRAWLGYATMLKKYCVSGFKSSIKYCIARLIGKDFFIRKLENLVTTYDMYDTKYCSTLVIASNPYREVESKIFQEVTKLNFERKEYFVPSRYKEYLSIVYGDYMKLPPKEKQVTNHCFAAYLKEEK